MLLRATGYFLSCARQSMYPVVKPIMSIVHAMGMVAVGFVGGVVLVCVGAIVFVYTMVTVRVSASVIGTVLVVVKVLVMVLVTVVVLVTVLAIVLASVSVTVLVTVLTVAVTGVMPLGGKVTYKLHAEGLNSFG